jgi:pimeloyl-ACP methyl ester carboxylesterase
MNFWPFARSYKRQYIQLRGHKIWASQLTPLLKRPSEAPVVLLHGGMSQSEGFDGRLLPSVKGFHVYSYDRAGHGRTPDQPGSFHFDFQCAEAVAYLEDVVKKPAHLIGTSDGGVIALLVAINRPELVKTLVLIGSNYSADDHGSPIPEWEPSPEQRAKYAKFSPDAPETLAHKIRENGSYLGD